MARILRMGMVGGGPGAFIGEVHRKAARMDGQIEIVAGVFSTDPEKSRATGRALGLAPDRVYTSYEQMAEQEAKLPADQRIDFVAVTTPNSSHFPIAKTFLEAGFHVMCEKPMTLTVAEAEELEKVVRNSGKVFGLMHNYTGYPMVKLARDLIRSGELGPIRKVVAIYPQGWLAQPIESESKQAAWRTDPRLAGAGCLGDIASHAENLAEYITGLKISELSADLTTFVPGRRLDDDVNCLLRFENGARGVLHASQISVGEENGLAIWVYGEKGGLEWHQEDPNHLRVTSLDGPEKQYFRGNPYVAAKSPAAARGTRTPSGHPEAFIEAFANTYVNFADTIRALEEGRAPSELENDFPKASDGVRGMKFIAAVVRNAAGQDKWTRL